MRGMSTPLSVARRTRARRLEQDQEELGEDEADDAAAREREDPGEDHFLGDAPVDGLGVLGGAGAHDGRGLGVRGGDGKPGERGDEQAHRGRDGGGKPLVLVQAHHLHAYLLDDLLAADRRADGHDRGAEDHDPEREAAHVADRQVERERDGEHGGGHELLAVLRAVHERHARGAEHLHAAEEVVGRPAICVLARDGDDLGDRPAGDEAEDGGEHEAVDDLDPLPHVDAVEAAGDRECGAGEAGDEGVALGGGDAEGPGAEAPGHDAHRRRRERDERRVGVPAEVDHAGDGVRHGGGDERHGDQADEVADDAHKNRRVHVDGTSSDGLGDGIGRISGTVDEDGAHDEDHDDDQKGIARQDAEKLFKANQGRARFLTGRRGGHLSQLC